MVLAGAIIVLMRQLSVCIQDCFDMFKLLLNMLYNFHHSVNRFLSVDNNKLCCNVDTLQALVILVRIINDSAVMNVMEAPNAQL